MSLRSWRARSARSVGKCGVVAFIAVVGLPPAATAVAAPERAFELVSPPGKNGGEVMADSGRTRSAADGAAVNFASLAAFGDPLGTNVASEYVAQRSSNPAPGNQGWTTHAITPAQEAQTFTAAILGAEPHYAGAFSRDLTQAVYRAWGPLTNDPTVADAANLYLRTDVRSPGPGTYSLVSPCPLCAVPLDASVARGFLPAFAGASDDFGHILFESSVALAPEASVGASQVYEWDHGAFRMAGVLPDGTAAPRAIAGRGVYVSRATRTTSRPISADGSRIVFTATASETAVAGGLYLRLAGRTTVHLNATERAAPGPAQDATYWDASSDQSRVFFTSEAALTDDAPTAAEPKLYMWRQASTDETQALTVSATGGTFTATFGGQTTAPIVFDASADVVQANLEALPTIGVGNIVVTGGPGDAAGTAPYSITFVGDLSGVNAPELQTDALSLSGGAASASVATTAPVSNLTYLNVDGQPADVPNEAGGVIGVSQDGRYVYFVALGQLVAGKPPVGFGVYLWHDGVITYVGQLAAFEQDALLDGSSLVLARKHTDLTPDGRHLLFSSTTGEGLLSAHGGVDYEHGDCGGTGVLATCRELYVYNADDDTLACASCNPSGAPGTVHAATRIRVGVGGTAGTNYLSHALSDDGRYAFFTTAEALVGADTNNREDAYVYDAATGQPQLLSSGAHASNSYFLDASANGQDAFFVTREQLVGWDRDQGYDLYDARIGGGFPEPIAPRPECAGEACQGPLGGPPAALGVGSIAVRGAGDLPAGKTRAPRKRCRAGKVRKRVKGKTRCVSRRKARARRQAHTRRHAGFKGERSAQPASKERAR